MQRHRSHAGALALVLLASCAVAPLAAQTITATIPDSIALGARVTVKLEARDAIGRIVPKPRGRVFVTCETPTIVSAAVDRLTAHAVGSTVCRAIWDRSDYARIEASHLVRVTAAATVPVDTVPVIVPPVDTAPVVTLVSLTISPEATVSLDSVGAGRSLSVWGRVSVDGAVRVARAGELPALTWSSSGPAVAARGTGGIWGTVTALEAGSATVSTCAGEICARRTVEVRGTPAPLIATRWVGVPPSSTPCARPLVAGELLEVTPLGVARFVRPLDGLPAWTYCVADSLAVTLDGWSGDVAAEPADYAARAQLPTVWPAVIEPDTTIRIESLAIVSADDDGGGLGATALGLLGAGAVVSLLAGANAVARRGRDEEA